MIHKTKALLALTASALVGSANAAVIYSSEDFEGGTPNYTIDNTGTGTLTQLQDGNLVNIAPATAFIGTDYVSGSTSRNGIVASGQPTNFSPGGTIPIGQHAFVSTSANRNMTLASPMTLVTDGVQSITVSFSYMFYGLGSFDALGSAELTYSPLGTFAAGDVFRIATFGFGQAGSTVVTPDYFATEDTWGSVNLSFTEAGAGITFTDTAKLRFNRVPLVGLVSPDVTTNHFTFFDDITVTGVIPEPTTPALLGLAGFALMRRRRK